MNSTTKLTVAAVLFCVAHTSTAFSESTLTYAFVGDSFFYDEPLAFLELAQVPAGGDEFIELTFSETVQSLFGYGPVYTGTFDSFYGEIYDDGTGVLRPAGDVFAGWADLDPPPSTVLAWDTIALDFFPPRPNSFASNVWAIYPSGSSQNRGVAGNWMLVPEPSAVVLAMLGVVGLGAFRRRRLGSGGVLYDLLTNPPKQERKRWQAATATRSLRLLSGCSMVVQLCWAGSS